MKKGLIISKHKLPLIICVMLIALILMFTTLYVFSDIVSKNQAKLGQERLREITSQSTSFVRLTANKEMKMMNSVAAELAELDDVKSDEAVDLIRKLCVGSDFERMAIDFTNGVSCTSDGYVVDISDLDYLKDIDKGETFITNLVVAKIDGQLSVSIISPIKKDGKVVAAARGTIYTSKFGELLEVNMFSGEGYFHLLNSKGEYLALSSSKNSMLINENYFDAIEKLKYDKDYSAKKIKSDMTLGIGGTSSYSYETDERYMEYMPVGISDWYLVVMVPKDIIDVNANKIQRDMYSVAAIFSVIYLGILIFFLCLMKLSENKIKKINEKLLAEEKRYLVLLERSDKVVFEFEFNSHSMDYSDKFIEIFGYKPTTQGIPKSIIRNKDIYPEDAEKIIQIFEMVESGEPSSSAEVRIRSANGKYLWCYIMLSTIFSENSVPVRALGIIENIDLQKQKEQELIAKAEKDQLTALYNKTATEKLIKNFLGISPNTDKKHALLIIDIDDFKFVNDNLGHLHGDVVLVTLAKCLTQIFSEDDIMGRIGGDEFFVFIKDIESQAAVVSRAQDICNLFRRTYSENSVSCHISASVGIAIFPQQGNTFETLYQNADSALYVAKSGGKDSCKVYEADVHVTYNSHRTEIENSQLLIKNQSNNE